MVTSPPKPLSKTDFRKAMEGNWKLSASRMIMSKADYDDIMALDQFECPGCGVLFSRDMGHPENGCDLGHIYNVMEL